MKALSQWKPKNIRFLFCDIDDTITTDGKLEPEAYSSLWKLHRAGIRIIPVTGRPAGWCELIARLWPVHGVIGENGAFYYRYLDETKQMLRYYYQDDLERSQNLAKIKQLGAEALELFPGTALASDQFCRVMDVAIDFCEDVPDLGKDTAKKIQMFFEAQGATAKVSSIHVNAWFGDQNKLKMCKTYCENEIKESFDSLNPQIAFAGDSPNDEPMFAAFQNSVGVQNVEDFISSLASPPQYVCSKRSGEGFVELANHLLGQ